MGVHPPRLSFSPSRNLLWPRGWQPTRRGPPLHLLKPRFRAWGSGPGRSCGWADIPQFDAFIASPDMDTAPTGPVRPLGPFWSFIICVPASARGAAQDVLHLLQMGRNGAVAGRGGGLWGGGGPNRHPPWSMGASDERRGLGTHITESEEPTPPPRCTIGGGGDGSAWRRRQRPRAQRRGRRNRGRGPGYG
jgi:hypothetical protein